MKQVYGKQVEWRDIKIGEAFYFTGCHGFAVKLNSTDLFIVDAQDRKYQCNSNDLITLITYQSSRSKVHVIPERVGVYGEFFSIQMYKLPRSFAKQLEAL